jgi:hypothetical protein
VKKKTAKDPTEPIRRKASRYPGVEQGTSCTQGSYKVGNTAFLYIGPQGGRFKAMFKLEKSKAQAAKLAKSNPDRYAVGSTAWVTARFSAEDPLPRTIWEAWLDESYALSRGTGGGAKRPAAKKKPAAKRKTQRKTRRRAQ